MKKLFFSPLFLLICGILPAQSFDSLSYQKAYRQNFENYYFSDSLSSATKVAGLSKAWAEAKFNFGNFDLISRLNWDSIYHAYIPKVLATRDKPEYYKVLQSFYHQLNDGHSLIIPPKDLWPEMTAGLPIRAKLLDGQVVITSLNSEEAIYSDLQPKCIIHKVNGLPVKEYSEKYIAPYISYSTPQDKIARLYSFFFTRGNVNEPVELELTTAGGKKITKRFKRKLNDELFPAAKGFSYTLENRSTGILTINTFNDQSVVPFLDSIFQKTKHPENLIIDLRNNGGGNGNNGFELIGYLTDKPFMTGKNVMREYLAAQRAWGDEPVATEITQYDWKPYKKPTFTGKVIVLAGPDTYSAAEDFLAAFKDLDRGLVMGQTTGGSTGQPLFFPLPFGGMGAVCSKRDLTPKGEEFIGIGLKPDIEIQPNLKNFLSGKDEVMLAAKKQLSK